ncbi:MAG TPA: phosphatidate cytidylyltransferase [Acidimicrobiales bacterium]|nr:phosphatidate cytidylyltransferase [Acidimicrobiales bacterium]
MSPRAARRSGRADRKSPGPNAALSLWGEPGQPEGYDPGAPTGPLELSELAEVDQQSIEAGAVEASAEERPRDETPGQKGGGDLREEDQPSVAVALAMHLSENAGLAGSGEAARGTDQVDESLYGEHDGETEASRSAQPHLQGGTIAEAGQKMEYPQEVVPPAELVITMSSGEGTELPHWADPPTGEVPRAVSGSKAQEDELQAWRLLGSRGLHWRDDVNDWSDGPGMEDLVDNDEGHGIAEEDAADRPFSFDNDFERLERERSERAGAASGETPIEGTVERYAPPGSGSMPSGDGDEDRTLGDRVGAGLKDQDESGDVGYPEAPPVPAGVGAMSSLPPMAPPGASPRRQRGPVGRNLRRPGSASANASPGAIASAAAARHAKRPYDVGADRAAAGGPGRDIGAAVATGAGLLALFVICYLVAPAALLALSAVVILGCALEAFAMFQRAGFRPATLLGALGSGGAVVAAYWRGSAALPVVLVVVVCASLVWYLARVVEARPVVNVAVTVFGFAWVGILGSFAGLMLAAPRGEHLFLGAVIPTVVADLAAWFAGSRFGAHPLAPSISPSKTWEGFAAGGIAALVAGAVIGSQVSPWGGVRHGLELGLVIAVVAPVGDLVQSMIKRDLRLKDSSSLLPGHGGLLDRFDSLLLALPATYFLATALHLA